MKGLSVTHLKLPKQLCVSSDEYDGHSVRMRVKNSWAGAIGTLREIITALGATMSLQAARDRLQK